jgi:hypothetical protein
MGSALFEGLFLGFIARDVLDDSRRKITRRKVVRKVKKSKKK